MFRVLLAVALLAPAAAVAPTAAAESPAPAIASLAWFPSAPLAHPADDPLRSDALIVRATVEAAAEPRTSLCYRIAPQSWTCEPMRLVSGESGTYEFESVIPAACAGDERQFHLEFYNAWHHTWTGPVSVTYAGDPTWNALLCPSGTHLVPGTTPADAAVDGAAAADTFAASLTGPAFARSVALSGTGKATGNTAALSGTGQASGRFVAASGTGDATSNDFWPSFLAVSGTGGADHAIVAISGTGDAGMCTVAHGEPWCTTGVAASGTGDARGNYAAVSGTGRAEGYVAVSGCDAADVCA